MEKYTKEEFNTWKINFLKDLPSHDKPSPDTKKEFNKIYQAINKMQKNMPCKVNSDRIIELEKAIYGDEKDQTNPGMKVQLDEIHKFFIGARGASKFIVWTFGGFGTIAVGWMALKAFLKSLV